MDVPQVDTYPLSNRASLTPAGLSRHKSVCLRLLTQTEKLRGRMIGLGGGEKLPPFEIL